MDEVQSPGAEWLPKTGLGALYRQVQSGTVAVQLYTNSYGRYVTQLDGDAVKSGYSFYKTIGYAYPRYGTNGEEFITLSGGGADWKFNKTAGCALWHVVYDGFQFVNNHDLGRQIQGGAQWYLSDGIRTNRYACAEAGMGCGQYDFSDSVTRMGSPVQYCYTNGQGDLLTKTLPLENVYVHAADYYEGTPLEPVLYQDVYFRKEITAGVLGMDRVLRWKQVFFVPENFTASNTNIVWSHNGVAASCLKASVTNLWIYNAAVGSLTNKTDNWWYGGTNKQFADYHITGKCIIMGADTNHCYGMMAKDTEDGGSIDFWMGYYWKSRGPIEEKGEFSANIVNMNGHNDQSWRCGENSYIAYLIVGTLSSVTNDAQKLFDERDSIPW